MTTLAHDRVVKNACGALAATVFQPTGLDYIKIKESIVRGAVIYAPGDVRVEQREDPRILYPTDAIIRVSAACICGSDLWPYRGVEEVNGPAPIGHEYVGIVEEIGSEVKNIKPGQFVVGSF